MSRDVCCDVPSVSRASGLITYAAPPSSSKTPGLTRREPQALQYRDMHLQQAAPSECGCGWDVGKKRDLKDVVVDKTVSGFVG